MVNPLERVGIAKNKCVAINPDQYLDNVPPSRLSKYNHIGN